MENQAESKKGGDVFIFLLFKALLAIGLGLAFLLNPQGMISSFSYLVGIILIIYGIIETISGIRTRRQFRFGTLVIEDGLLNIIIGLVLIFWPNLGPNVVMIILGFWILIGGVIQLVIANKYKNNRAGRNLRGLLTVILGAIIIFNPSDSVKLISMLVGWLSLVYGLFLVVQIIRFGKNS
jgi:uncharacterized membrane protein HdeD (DUF308 family)